jgi:transcriptional regulator with XRE-family HTH domain
MSLADVAGEAHVSAATLSRVERDKQAIDIQLFLILAKILNTAPADLLGDDHREADKALAVHIAAMESRERTKLWRELNEERKEGRMRRRADLRMVSSEVEELLAQMDFLREEIDAVRARLSTKKKI